MRSKSKMSRKKARDVLASIGHPRGDVLEALRVEVRLPDTIMCPLLDCSRATLHRWRSANADLPPKTEAALDDLRAIVAMLINADFDGATIKSFLMSRNIGLGQDRPIDGLRLGMDGFRRVEYVTECFIAAIAPDPGSALSPSPSADT